MYIDAKKCNKCDELKPFSEFCRHKGNKDGRAYSCKSCSYSKRIEYRKTRESIAPRIYSSQKQSSEIRNHELPNYTRIDLQNWIFSQPNFEELYNNWVESGYDKMMKPSVDRKNDYLPYTLDNIRLVTWMQNNDKHYEDRKNGINNKHSKSVSKFDLSGNLIDTYYSQKQAGRVTGISPVSISRCCIGTLVKPKNKAPYMPRTAGGFIWEFS